MRKRAILVTLALLLGICATAQAQRFTASIRGTITSSDNGAELAGAQVKVTNTETGLTRSAVANSQGNYSFGDLPVGTYRLNFEFPDFKSIVVTDVVLNVADVRQVDANMELGAVEDEITVMSPALVVETIGGEIANVITGEEVRELPLNGRNFTQLTQLMPGVSSPDGLDFKNKGLLSGVDTSVNGSSATGNNWAIDGSSNNDTGSNRTILIYPSIEAIEEFKVHRNSYGPEFGGAGGAQINLVTKSGTNNYKGSVFSFFRDDSWNEPNTFLEQAGQDTEPLDRKDFGYTFGGPILKDKLQFFISQEWNDETRGIVRSEFVPTEAERGGDFSQRVPGCSTPVPIDPLTGQPFPGNVIPTDRLSPGGLALLSLYPTPNLNSSAGNCNNWVTAVPTDIEWNQINARLDYTVSESSRALIRYTADDWDNPAPNAGATNGLWGDDPFPTVDSTWNQPGESMVAQLNNVFSSDIVNTFTYSRSGNEINVNRGPEGQALNAQINSLILPTFPDSDKSGGSERSHPVYWGGATGDDLWNIAPWSNDLDVEIYKNDYQQVFGNHYMKAGVLYAKNKKKESCCGSSGFESPHFWGGTGISPWGANSGNRIADILIRDMTHGFDENAFQPAPLLEWEDVEIYVGDSWKIADNVTFDYGIRYSRYKEPFAVDNNIASFDPTLFDPALGGAPCNGIAQVPGTDPCGDAGLIGGGQGVSSSFVESDTDNFAPRLGLAWDVSRDGTSVLRAGFGQYYQRERVNIQLDFGGQPPFTRNVSGIRTFDDPVPVGGGVGFGVPNRGIDPNNETPYNFQFNLTWEQRVGRDNTLEVSYVGNRGRHLVRKSDINQVPAGDQNGNGISDRLEYIRGGGPGDGSVRPYFQGGDNRILYWENNGASEYDALQMQWQSRFGRGSIFQASYTYSSFKANDSLTSSSAGEENIQITDRDNPDLDWGYAGLHRDHIFNASLVYNLPSFEGRGGFLEAFLGDWTIGSVIGYSSGSPITVYGIDIPGLGGSGFAGTGYDDNNRPIRVDGVSCSGSGNQIINPDAFTFSGLRLGDTSQMSARGACEGPDYFQVDLSFYKNIRIGKRFEAQFRIEIFNLTNEVNYIGASVENSIRPTNVVLDAPLSEATQIVSADIPGTFGQANATRDPRQIQLGLKLSF